MKLIRQIQKYTNSLFKRRVIILEPKLLQHHHLSSDPNRLADRKDEGIRKRDSEFHRGNSPFPAGSFSFQRHSFSLGMYALLRRSASALHTLRSSQPFRRCIMGSRLLGGFLPSSPISFQTFVRFASTYTATVGVCLAARECRLRRLVVGEPEFNPACICNSLGRTGRVILWRLLLRTVCHFPEEAPWWSLSR